MQRVAGSYHSDQEYDKLLAQAVKLGRQHETKAKDFVPKMYEILVKGEGLEPSDAADRIYKDLVGIWQKDTIRRLLPADCKNQAARDMQVLSRFPLESKAGLILREHEEAASAGDNQDNDRVVAMLADENARLRKTVEELQSAKKSLLERTLRLEKLLAEVQRHRRDLPAAKEEATATIVLPPHLFMKTFSLMRGATKPLVFKITAREAVDVDRMRI